MANTYTWITNYLSSYPTYQSQTDVVFNIQYKVVGTDGTNTFTLVRSQAVTYIPNETFIPYNELTDAICIGWVQTALGPGGVSSVESQVNAMLIQASLPQPQNMPLPWVSTVTTTTSGASGS
jgi:hypothetical protein